jgi:8-oxo-dGTP pyrophosphatase MutT (NUDIX family)
MSNISFSATMNKLALYVPPLRFPISRPSPLLFPLQASFSHPGFVSSLFLASCPQDVLSDTNRVLFKAEQALWSYLDHWVPKARQNGTQLPVYENDLTVRFLRDLFSPLASDPAFAAFQSPADLEVMLRAFVRYKASIPTAGAIILDETLKHIALFRIPRSPYSYSISKGKQNEEEALIDAAQREVFEETGLDILYPLRAVQECHLHDGEDPVPNAVTADSHTMLYLCPGIPQSFNWNLAVTEADNVCWFPLEHVRDTGDRRAFTKIAIKAANAARKWCALHGDRIRRLIDEANRSAIATGTDRCGLLRGLKGEALSAPSLQYLDTKTRTLVVAALDKTTGSGPQPAPVNRNNKRRSGGTAGARGSRPRDDSATRSPRGNQASEESRRSSGARRPKAASPFAIDRQAVLAAFLAEMHAG